MYRRLLRSIMLTSFAVLSTASAFAEVRADLGPVHIRIASNGPPRARWERRENRPYQDAVYIRGYWDWDRQDHRWAWVSGRWERPSDRRARWIDARYQREGNAWRYEPAHWSHQQLVEGDDYQQWRNEHRDRRHD